MARKSTLCRIKHCNKQQPGVIRIIRASLSWSLIRFTVLLVEIMKHLLAELDLVQWCDQVKLLDESLYLQIESQEPWLNKEGLVWRVWQNWVWVRTAAGVYDYCSLTPSVPCSSSKFLHLSRSCSLIWHTPLATWLIDPGHASSK